jgi:hypothetical protein
MRLSDPERERAVERLKSHYALGRLSLGEFETRVERVYDARTRRSAAVYLADLPLRGARQLALGATRSAQRFVMRLHLSAYMIVNLSLVAVWLMLGQGVFWPAVFLVPSTALLVWHALLSRRLTRAIARLRW